MASTLPVRTVDVPQQVLDKLDEKETLNSTEDFPNTPQVELKAALDRLASRSMVAYKQITEDHVVLDKEGQTICDEGSPEYRVWDTVRSKGKVGIKELAVSLLLQKEIFGRRC
jgi:phenylalanyl-tRNA synthetase alpha chain